METFIHIMGCVFITLIVSGLIVTVVICLTPATKHKEEVKPEEKGSGITMRKTSFNWMPTNNN